MDEVAFFIREYPRAYRYHLACADFRLETICQLYRELHHELTGKINDEIDLFEVSQSDRRVQRIYWDFESFLTETGIALDLLARNAGTPERRTRMRCRRASAVFDAGRILMTHSWLCFIQHRQSG